VASDVIGGLPVALAAVDEIDDRHAPGGHRHDDDHDDHHHDHEGAA
jgi:hypothetical protein